MKRGRLQRKDLLGADVCMAVVTASARSYFGRHRAPTGEIDAALAERLGREVGVRLTEAKLIHLERYRLVVDAGDARYWGITPWAAVILGLREDSPGIPPAPRWQWDDARFALGAALEPRPMSRNDWRRAMSGQGTITP